LIIDHPGLDDQEEYNGRYMLAIELLENLIVAGRVRLFGRKAEVIESDGFEEWGDLGNYTRVSPSDFVNLESSQEEFGEELLEGFAGDRVGFWAPLLALDDLIEAFPKRGFEEFSLPPELKIKMNESVECKAVSDDSKSLDRAEPPLIKQAPRRTAGAVKRCIRWIEGLAKAGNKPLTRTALFEEARQVIGDGLSERGFNHAWAQAAPDDWKAPGRKPRRDPPPARP